MKRLVFLSCLLLVMVSQARLGAFEIEWKALSGEVTVKAENGSVPGMTILKGKGRVKGCTLKAGKASGVRIRCDVELMVDGKPEWNRIVARPVRASDGSHEFRGAIGVVSNIQKDYMKILEMEERARKNLAGHEAYLATDIETRLY